MSKPISFGFCKSKPVATTKQAISLPARKQGPALGGSRSALHQDSDEEEEQEPRHESVTGFSSSGVILSQPVQEKSERVIKNPGNSDWRKRGQAKNILPAEVQAAHNGDVVMVERNEVSKASGLQFSAPSKHGSGVVTAPKSPLPAIETTNPLTEDEKALQSLLDDSSGKANSNAIIKQLGNTRLASRDETDDFRSDVASRPESSTLEEYAAMPVEEFGMAMLRGMGQKRRANGEVIDLSGDNTDDNSRKIRKNEGFLGIGAKAAPGADIELGAWGKADMRKNQKGEGFFTPLMRENKETGERITEEELQKKIKEAKGQKGDADWRERRDRNLERSGRGRGRDDTKSNGGQKTIANGDRYRDQMNDFSKQSSSRRDRNDRDYDSSRSRRERDDWDYYSSSSHQDRSRSRDHPRRDDDDHDSRHRERRRNKYRDDDRYDSGSSRRSGHSDRERDDDVKRHREKR